MDKKYYIDTEQYEYLKYVYDYLVSFYGGAEVEHDRKFLMIRISDVLRTGTYYMSQRDELNSIPYYLARWGHRLSKYGDGL